MKFAPEDFVFAMRSCYCFFIQCLTVAQHREKTRADVAMCKHQATVRP
jgi:hypothetical protein